MARRFFYVCAGLLCLVLAYHLGAQSATAQEEITGEIVEIAVYGNQAWVVTDENDIYVIDRDKAPAIASGTGWQRFGLGVLR